MDEIIRGHDLGGALVGIVERGSPWANAALPRVTGLVGKPEPASRLGSPSDHPISQEHKEASNGD